MGDTVQKHLVIFAKEPRIGRVKTRLARGIGPVAAWQFYRSMVAQIPKRLTKAGDWQVWLAVAPDPAVLKKGIWPNGVRLLAQGEGDLGTRMWRPRQTLPHGAVIVIGTDIPTIQPDMIKRAFDRLRRCDFVFGPAEDGGFWLVGYGPRARLRNPYVKGVRWSHEQTLNDCLGQIHRQGNTVGFVDVLSDVDEPEDWHAWRLQKREINRG